MKTRNKILKNLHSIIKLILSADTEHTTLGEQLYKELSYTEKVIIESLNSEKVLDFDIYGELLKTYKGEFSEAIEDKYKKLENFVLTKEVEDLITSKEYLICVLI